MWQIEDIEIAGAGYLRGLKLKLPAGLTCIIGPRGSGKTSLAEALRFALTGLPTDSKTRSSLLKDNLGQATIILTTLLNGEGYTVSRSYPGAAALSARDGRTLTGVELDRGTFLPLDAFSSREIEDIADESLGARRRQLLDSLKSEQLRDIELVVAEKRRALDANADLLRASLQSISALREQIEELSGARDRLAALPVPEKGEQADRLIISTRQQNLTQLEVDSLRKAWHDIDTQRLRLVDIRESISLIDIASDADSVNAEAILSIKDILSAAFLDTDASIEKAINRLHQLLVSITESGKDLKNTQAEQATAHQRLIEAHATLGQAINIRNKAQQDVAKLGKLERDLKDSLTRNEELLLTRRSLKAQYVTERDRISALREKTADELAKDCGPNVRLLVERNADSQAYQQLLLKSLSRTGLRGQEDIVQELMALRPEQLSQILMENDIEELDHALRIGQERIKKVYDALSANINSLELEVFPTDDRIKIELNVGTEMDPLYKDASELSRGQKCTALLPLLLARRDTPLLIDQPEDNLDNHFIYETVVDAIKRMKTKRQMIFITHNANIPVLAEAELVVVMDSDGRQGQIQKMGTLDECREEIIDLLEGGKEAFDLRSERYGRQ